MPTEYFIIIYGGDKPIPFINRNILSVVLCLCDGCFAHELC